MMHRTALHAAVLMTLALLATLVGPARPAQAQTNPRCFVETGFCISGTIRTFWEQNGGLAVFGLPLGPQEAAVGSDGQTRQVQQFERHRLELHPENPAPYNVLLGRIGVERLAQQGRDWQTFPPFDENTADAERCAFFRETGRQVCDEFLQAFRSNGLNFAGRSGITFEESLALFGFPISDAQTEIIEGQEYLVQWFERARFELHPANPPASRVLFGRLGAELSTTTPILTGRDWYLVSFGATDQPHTSVGDRPVTLRFEEDRLAGQSGCNNFGGGYSLNGSQITFQPFFVTSAACTDDVLNRQEQAILGALQGSAPFELTAERLVLRYDNGRQALVYTATAPGAVTGTVSYLQRIALAPNAVVEVKLVDVSRADAPAIVISSLSFVSDGRQVPLPFELRYDPSQIDERMTYAVQARITIDGQLTFINTQNYSVLTRGAPSTNVEIIVQMV
ncbi:MAG: YbaY family lipoprotein [Oscillochloridaceae bacterium umkhey_bin13]